MVDDGTATDSAHGETVDLVVGADVRTTVADRDILHDAGIVGVVGAAVFGARGNRQALNVVDAVTRAGVTEHDETAPATGRSAVDNINAVFPVGDVVVGD